LHGFCCNASNLSVPKGGSASCCRFSPFRYSEKVAKAVPPL
jgi:hypothetical protein